MTKDELFVYQKELHARAEELLKTRSQDFTSANDDPFNCLQHTADLTNNTVKRMIISRMLETVLRIQTLNGSSRSMNNACLDMLCWTTLLAAKEQVDAKVNLPYLYP
jgi:hypothetical protein